jgi:linoleate 10R-lipoxygenase
LADAVALVRGDRHFTADYSPHNLTAWGFQDCQRSGENAGFGSMLGRLFLRTLPRQYTEDSTFTWFPLMTPEAMKEVLSNVETKDKYDFKRPEYVPAPVHVKEYGEVAGILTNKTKFQDPFLNRVAPIIDGPG